MKRIVRTMRNLALTLSFFALLWQPAKACVDYHTTVFITCHYDSTNFTDIAITVSNLRIFGGSPNDFCSCGITNYTDIFTNLQYVAFVDSGTTNPLAGFDPWTPSSNATNAWESVLATGDWSGFVSGVNSNGLVIGAPVELIIRASLPPGYTYSILDSNLTVTQMGTDEWSDANQNLTNSHQSITGFWSGGQPDFVAEQSGSTYFSDLDDAILLSAKQPQAANYLNIYPIPAIDRLYVQLKDRSTRVESARVYNSAGQLIEEIALNELASGQAAVDVSSYPEGIYFLRVRSSQGEQTKKFIHLK